MTRKKYSLLLAFAFISISLTGQIIQIPNNALLRTILSQRDPIIHITSSRENIIPLSEIYKTLKQQILYTEKGLFIFVDATGQIYKATKWNNEAISFIRLDSTSYFGYNSESLKVFRNDTLFSFGGYGFWHFNGYLSHFDLSRYEWEISPLNEEVPFYGKENILTSLFFISPKHSNIYFTEVLFKQHGIKNEKKQNNYLYNLNIESKEVKPIGVLSLTKDEINQLTNTRKILTPYGVLYDNPKDEKKDYLIDYQNNQILISNELFIQKIIRSKNNLNQNIFFYRNGYIYGSCYPFESVDSIKFNISSFKKTNQKLYSSIENPISSNKYFILIACIILSITIIIGIIFTTSSKRKSNLFVTDSEPKSTKIDIKEIEFNELEKQLLKVFIEKIELKGEIKVEELNSILGVSNKTIEVKKKARTEFITKVNFKLKNILNMNYDLIERERSKTDKRSYLYYIKKEYLLLLKKLIEE